MEKPTLLLVVTTWTLLLRGCSSEPTSFPELESPGSGDTIVDGTANIAPAPDSSATQPQATHSHETYAALMQLACHRKGCISCNTENTCAVKTNGNLRCWGSNYYNQISIPSGFTTGIAQVSVGYIHICAVNTSAWMLCWGSDFTNRTAIPASWSAGIRQVVAGFDKTCAVKMNGTLNCWGGEREYSIPEGFTQNIKSVVLGYRAIALFLQKFYDYTCAVTMSGDLACWGSLGLEGDPQFPLLTIPEGFSSGVASVYSSGDHLCILKTNGDFACTGANDQQQATVPRLFASGVAAAAVGRGYTCAVKTNGAFQCWGSLSAPPHFLLGVTSVAGGELHACAINSQFALACWGEYATTATPPDPPKGWAFLQGDTECSALCDHNTCDGNDKCGASCLPGTYKTEDGSCAHCLDAIPGCLQCSGPNACSTCAAGFGRDDDQCVPCGLDGCQSCSGQNGKLQCDACLPAYNITSNNGVNTCEAVELCGDGFFPFNCKGVGCKDWLVMIKGQESGCVPATFCEMMYSKCLAEQKECVDCCTRVRSDTGKLWYLLRYGDGTLLQCDPPPISSRQCRCDTDRCRWQCQWTG